MSELIFPFNESWKKHFPAIKTECIIAGFWINNFAHYFAHYRVQQNRVSGSKRTCVFIHNFFILKSFRTYHFIEHGLENNINKMVDVSVYTLLKVFAEAVAHSNTHFTWNGFNFFHYLSRTFLNQGTVVAITYHLSKNTCPRNILLRVYINSPAV